MIKLYMVKTYNRHGQVLLFKSRSKAISWLVAVLRDDYLSKAIQDIKEIPIDRFEAFNLFGVDQHD